MATTRTKRRTPRPLTLKTIPFGIPVMSRPQMDLFNERGRSVDTVLYLSSAIPNATVLAGATSLQNVGWSVLNAPSYQALTPALPEFAPHLEGVHYDLEDWVQSQGEQHDIGGSAAAMQELVAGAGLTLSGGLSVGLAVQAGTIEDFAPHMPTYAVQGYPIIRQQGYAGFQVYLDESIRRAKAVNSAVKIAAVLTVESPCPTADETGKFIESNLAQLDQVFFWLDGSEDSTNRLREVLDIMRPL